MPDYFTVGTGVATLFLSLVSVYMSISIIQSGLQNTTESVIIIDEEEDELADG